KRHLLGLVRSAPHARPTPVEFLWPQAVYCIQGTGPFDPPASLPVRQSAASRDDPHAEVSRPALRERVHETLGKNHPIGRAAPGHPSRPARREPGPGGPPARGQLEDQPECSPSLAPGAGSLEGVVCVRNAAVPKGLMRADPLGKNSVLGLLCDLIRIPSVNPALGDGAAPGEKAIATFSVKWLEEHGVRARLEEAAPGRPNAVGETGSGSGKTLVLCAHLDTVGVAGMTAPYPPSIRDGRVYGRGAYDMKSGVGAVMCRH